MANNNNLNNKAELQIKITDELRQASVTTRQLYEKVNSKNGFKGKRGTTAKATIEGNLQTVDRLLQQESLSKTDFLAFQKTLKEAAKLIAEFSVHITSLSKEAKKLQDSLNKEREKLDKASDNLVAAKDTRSQAIQAIKDNFNYEGYKVKKDGSLYKTPISTEKILEYRSKGKEDSLLFKSKLNPLEMPVDFNNTGQSDLFDNYLKADERVKSLTEKLHGLEKAVNSLTQKFQDTITKDKESASSTSKNDIDLISASQQNTIDISQLTGSTLGEAQDLQAQQDLKSISIEPLKKQQTALSKAFKAFTIYAAAIKLAKSALQEATRTVVELDKSLTEQAMVTGMSRQEVYSLLSSYQNLAQSIGATTKEVAEASSEFIKQGKSISEALTLSKAAVSAAKVAGVSVSASINYLTTALNGFKLSADDAMSVSDKFAAIAAASASDYDEIATALSKVASQAKLAGMSIDYTTALLTTGLEVTREAPETMGTALKTIIARMREISDYGETLEDGTDLNNVETQLKYIGIALTDDKGELRSTEDVLDELGKKWQDLNSNQQAAIAKALAGTRQQSRLIAMMDNYERVQELNEISQRSSGATAAQLSKYMEGFEAAINNIKVAWEKLVETFVNSNFVATLINGGASILNTLNNIASNPVMKWLVYGGIAESLMAIIAKKQLENEIVKAQEEIENQKLIEQGELFKKQQEEIALEEEKKDLAEYQEKQKAVEVAQNELINAQKQEELAISNAEIAKNNLKTKILERQLNLQKAIQLNELAASQRKAGDEASAETNKKNAFEYENKIKETDIVNLTNKATKAENDLTTAKTAVAKAQTKLNEAIEECNTLENKAQQSVSARLATNQEYQNNEKSLAILKSKNNGLLTLGIQKMALESSIKSVLNLITSALNVTTKLLTKTKKKENVETVKSAVATTADTTAKTANTVATGALTVAVSGLKTAWHKMTIAMSSNLVGAAILAFTAAAAVIASVTVAVIKLLPNLENVSKTVGTLTNEIYELNKANTSISNALSAYEDFDELLIKTNDDAKSLNETLSQVKDSLTESQQKLYASAQSDSERVRLLKQFQTENSKQIKEDWEKAQTAINSLSDADKKRALGDLSTLSDSDLENATTIQNAIYALGNYQLYQAIDKNVDLLGDAKDAVETLGASIVSNLSADKLNNLEQNGGIENLVKNLTNYKEQIKGLADSSTSLVDQVKYYKEISEGLQTDSEQLKVFQEQYSQYQVFSQMNDDVLNLIDSMGISSSTLNSLYTAYKSLKDENGDLLISKEDYQSRFPKMLEIFKETQDVTETIKAVFGDIVDEADSEVWDRFVNIFDKLTVNILTIGQNIDSFNNKVSSFYEKAASWSTMSESDKSTFINDNAELFKGSDGAQLLNAFETGDYQRIEAALKSNESLQKLQKERLQEVETALAVEEARSEDSRNEAYIKELKALKKHLENVDELYEVSLATRLEQEQNQLSEFKSYLQEEENEITKSLNKRKDAYNKYFEAIKDSSSDEEYEENATKYITNLTKLGSSTDASSQSQRAELENKLQDLEKEHLEDLRERAQDAIISNIEDEIDQISDKFDDLLDNNRQMLLLMSGQLDNQTSGFFSNLLSSKVYNGATANEVQDYLTDLQSLYGSKLNGVDLSDVKVEQNGSSLVLNVNGQTYNLDSTSQQSLYETIMTALRQLGIK